MEHLLEYVQKHIRKRKMYSEIEVQERFKFRSDTRRGVCTLTPRFTWTRISHRKPKLEQIQTEVIKNRMKVAREELCLMKYYDYSVVNDKVENAVQQIEAIIQTEHWNSTEI